MANPMWNAILKWSISQTDGTESTSGPDREIKPMSEEDRAFLDAAMKSMVIDEVERVKLILLTLRLPDDAESLFEMYRKQGLKDKDEKDIKIEKEDPQALADLTKQKKEEALDELEDRVVTLDMAINLWKLGGFEVLSGALQSPHKSIQTRAANVMGVVLQNNTLCCEKALGLGMLPLLLDILSPLLSHATEHTNRTALSSRSEPLSGVGAGTEGGDLTGPLLATSRPQQPPQEDQDLAHKGLLALSALIRDFEPGLRAFTALNGVEAVSRIIAFPLTVTRTKKRAMHLARHLCNQDAITKAGARLAADPAVVQVIVEAIKTPSDLDLREIALRLCNSIVSSGDHVPAILRVIPNLPTILLIQLREIKALTDPEEIESREDEKQLLTDITEYLLTDPSKRQKTSSSPSSTIASSSSPMLALGPPSSSSGAQPGATANKTNATTTSKDKKKAKGKGKKK